jgi:flagellar hook assembly protein FlgD
MLTCRPNPVRSTALVGFIVPRAGNVSMSVYDIAGRLVRALPTTVFPAGRNEIRWDGRDRDGRQVSSGVYFCRVNAGDRAGIVKAVLLR